MFWDHRQPSNGSPSVSTNRAVPQRFRAEDHARRKAREELEDAMNSRDLGLREQQLEIRLQQALREEDHLRQLREASNQVSLLGVTASIEVWSSAANDSGRTRG